MFPPKASYYGALKSCFFEVFQENTYFWIALQVSDTSLTVCPCKACSKESKQQLKSRNQYYQQWKFYLTSIVTEVPTSYFTSSHLLLCPHLPIFSPIPFTHNTRQENWEENVQKGSMAQKLKRSQIKTACPCCVSPKLQFPLQSMKERDSTHRL